MPRSLWAAVLLFAPAAGAAADPARPIVFRNATIYADGAVIQPGAGALAIKDGKIEAVGKIDPGPNVEVIDLQGAVIIPGLVDTHSHIGIYPKPAVAAHQDGNEMSGPVQGMGRALDAIDPNDPGIRMAVAGGITTANIMPGSGNVIGGQTLYVKLRGRTVEEMRLYGKRPDGGEVLGGLKMANGENPKGYGRRGQAPFTRMKVAALQREQFVKAKEYLDKIRDGKKPDRDLALEPLAEVLQKKRTVHFHCHRADDLLTAVRLSEEFGFELVLQHATEGYRVADLLAAKKIPVSLTIVDSPGGKAETIGLLEENAAVLDKAGVPLTINTDDFITESRFLLKTGAIAVRGGLSVESALKALTSTPAAVMHLGDRIGTLAPGLDADFVILSGPPFSTYTKVKQTWIDGVKVFDAADDQQRPYRDGGLWLPRAEGTPAVEFSAAPKPAETPKELPETREARKPGLFYVRAGRVHTANGAPIENGAVVIEDGVIKAVGPEADVKRPFGATTLAAKEVTPGLIDPHTVAGISGAWNTLSDQDQDETSDPNQSDLRVMDGFNPNEPLLEFLRANGVSIVHAAPGRAAIVAGQSAVFRTDGRTADSALNKAAGLLVNLGEAPKEAFKEKGPKTRMGVAGLVRKAFADAQAYKAKKDAPKNPKLEPLAAALDGKLPVYLAAHRADDILTGLRIADEFGLKPVVVLGTDAYRITDELVRRKVPVVVHPTTQRPGGSMETLHTFLGTAAHLKAKGVPVTLCTNFEGYVPKQRNLRTEAAVAAANGLGQTGALRAITLDAAKLLGVADQHGSIEVGKVADVVLYDGDPFEHTSHVTHTLLAGKLVYERAEYLKLPFDRRILPLLGGGPGVGCCLGVW